MVVSMARMAAGSVAGKGLFEIIKTILRKALDGEKEDADKTIKTVIEILQLLLQILEALDRLQD